MPSAKPSKTGKSRGCLATALAVSLLLLLALYLLLSSGSLGGFIHSLVLKITSGNGEAVHVYGASTDLFTYVRADSVVVVNEQELRVAVFGADVKGSVYDYLVLSDVERILVDSIDIHTPLPSGGPPDSSLSPIFTGTMAGMVTRTDTVRVLYGRVVDPTGLVLVDSMRLNARIVDIEEIELDIREASAFIPLFGSVTASGSLMVDSNSTSLESFHVICPPGIFDLSCYLNSDSTFGITFSGSVTSDFIPEAPPASGFISGSGSGSIMDPLVTFSLSQGKISYNNLDAELAADSISSTRELCTLSGFSVVSNGVSALASGSFSYSDLSWQGLLDASFYGADLSSFLADFPGSSIHGTVSASAAGNAGYLDSGRVSCRFDESRIDQYSVLSLILNCNINQRELSGTLQTDFGGGTISSEFSTSLGLDFAPVAWRAVIDATVNDCGVLSLFTDPLVAGARGLTVRASGEGSLSAFSMNGDIGLGYFSGAGSGIRNAAFSGSFASSSSGMQMNGEISVDSAGISDSLNLSISEFSADLDLSGMPDDFRASGTVGLESATYNNLSTGLLAFDGDFSMNSEGVQGRGGLSIDSILLAGSSYSLGAVFNAEPGSIHLDSLTLGAPGDLSLDLSGLFQYGADSLAFDMDGIALTRSGKLRLISEGDMEFVSDSAGFVLDTLWLDLPSGEIIADGWISSDSINISAILADVDIASFTTMLGLDVPISGILGVEFSSSGAMGDLQTVLSADIQHPTYDDWDQSDSLTIDIHSMEDSLVIDGVWTWTEGVRSGFRIGMDRVWNSEQEFDLGMSDVCWLEAELTGVGDELFYLLPMPFKTSGASVSARVEYQRDSAELSVGLASHFQKLYLTNPGIEFPGVSAYLTYPDQRAGDSYNGRFSLTSGEGQSTTLQSTVLLGVEENLSFEEGTIPLSLNSYNFNADIDKWETLVAGVGWLQISGNLFAESDDLTEKPKIIGKLTIDEATISMGGGGTLEGSGGGSAGHEAQLPLDLSIRITGDRGIWFRNSFANVELSVAMDLSTLRGQVLVGGEVKAIRGAVYLLGRDFQITQGDVRVLQTAPLGIELNVQAVATIRSSVSGAEYTVTVTVTGDPDEPDFTLAGTGPSGTIDDRDIATLLTAGMTYGELQQFDSSAFGSVAGNYLGQWLARSIRDDVGLDALQFTPDFSSDSTSLVVNAGKYVLPDLFVSFSSDVFSSEAGTLRAQYYFNRDFFFEGSTKSTFTGNQEPSLELHYTYRY